MSGLRKAGNLLETMNLAGFHLPYSPNNPFCASTAIAEAREKIHAEEQGFTEPTCHYLVEYAIIPEIRNFRFSGEFYGYHPNPR